MKTNWGNKYTFRHYIKNKKEGVFYMNFIKKWIVRINKKGVPTTISQHNKQEEAEKAYETALKNI